MGREVKVAILGDARDFSRATDQVDRDARRLGGSVDGAGKKWAKFGKLAVLGAGAAVAGAAMMAKGFIDAATESQKVTKQTDAVLKSIGATSWTSSKKVAALSTELSLMSGVDDELIQSGENLLLTFKNIQNRVGQGNDIFDQATKVMVDMSVAMGTDMKSASIQVGKALNDPIKGITALTRVGVTFSAAQKEQIAQMVAVGDTAGAQKVILAELTSEFGGSAEAQATAGAKLSVAWGNIQEQLGTALLPLFNKLATWLAVHLPAAMAVAQEWGRRTSAWIKQNETAAKALAVVVGTVLVAAMVAYAASAASAAVATIVATYPFILAAMATAALAAALWYAYNNWGWFRDGVDKARYSLGVIVGWIASATGYVRGLADAIGTVLGPLSSLLSMGSGLGRIGGLISGIRGGLSHLPGFAQGGTVPGALGQPKIIMAHGGEEVVTHGQQMRTSGGGGGNTTVVLEVGGRELGRFLVDALGRVEASNGAVRVRTRTA